MKRSLRWLLGALGVLVVLGCGAFTFLMLEVAPVGTAYTAKRMCSCVFVAHRDPSSVLREELGKYGYISTDIDYKNKTVTGSILGMAKRTALYRDGLGCTLAAGMSVEALRKQPAGFTAVHEDRENIPWPDGDLIRDEPLPKIIDGSKLKKVVEAAFIEPDPARLRRTRAVIVLYDGRIVAEHYALGFTRDTPQLGWSMTKSITNALVGILVKEGRLRLKDPAPVSEWRSPGDPRGAITLDELMRMSSGLKFKEDYKDPFSDVVRMLFLRSDAGAFATSMPLEVAPDSRWQYSSGTANIISRIVRQTLGGSLRDYFVFPHHALFDKIGMASAVMEPDPSGTFVGSSFMYATARDWARFGLLCLDDGIWHAERILPEGWMKYSTTPTPKAPKRKYGAQFWLNAGDTGNPDERWMPGAPPDMYSLAGFEGQYVSMVPSKKLVIVRLGLSDPDENWDQGRFIADIVDAVR
ncbi:MAG: serine hydrolase [Desulfomonilia bacterium]|jgi:CubicO group peptidase (beta-lactamase class C family)